MEVLRTPAALRESASALRRSGKRIGLVPTMGGLHEGHLSLLRLARPLCDKLVMSLFINPTQFGPGEDLDRYPRDEKGDHAAAEECGVDIIYSPDASSMYPSGFQTSVTVAKLASPMCGAGRPNHFEGVATVVTKLFNAAQPDVAVFGQKDAQQLAIIRQLVSDLDFGIKIVGAPIVREADGLAMSSRNAYLRPDARKQATCLFRGLSSAKQRFDEGATDASTLIGAARAVVEAQPLATLEYLDLRDAKTLEPVDKVGAPALLALAVAFGQTRLIDNLVLG